MIIARFVFANMKLYTEFSANSLYAPPTLCNHLCCYCTRESHLYFRSSSQSFNAGFNRSSGWTVASGDLFQTRTEHSDILSPHQTQIPTDTLTVRSIQSSFVVFSNLRLLPIKCKCVLWVKRDHQTRPVWSGGRLNDEPPVQCPTFASNKF